MEGLLANKIEKLLKLNRTQNAVRNMAFGLVNKIVTLVCPFIIRTLIIKLPNIVVISKKVFIFGA